MTLAEPIAVTIMVVNALEGLSVRYAIGGSARYLRSATDGFAGREQQVL